MTTMRTNYFLFLGALTFIFASCNKISLETQKEEWDRGSWSPQDLGKKDCIYLLYPQTYTMPDGTGITLIDKDNTAMKDWYNANPHHSTEKPELQYPVSIKNQNHDIQVINSHEEMVEAKKNCEEEDQ